MQFITASRLNRLYNTLVKSSDGNRKVLQALTDSKNVNRPMEKAVKVAPLLPLPKDKIVARQKPTLTLVQQLTNNIMKDGKKQTAENIVNEALLYVQKRTNQAPAAILETCIEKVSPFVKIKSVRQGARSVGIPVPLSEKQRKRIGIKWLIDQVKRVKTPVTPFGLALGQELLKVMNGTCGVLQKAVAVHKQALQNRSNVRMKDRIAFRGRKR